MDGRGPSKLHLPLSPYLLSMHWVPHSALVCTAPAHQLNESSSTLTPIAVPFSALPCCLLSQASPLLQQLGTSCTSFCTFRT